MTAVVCSLGPVQRVVDAGPAVSGAVVDAVAMWAAAPLPASVGPALIDATSGALTWAMPVVHRLVHPCV